MPELSEKSALAGLQFDIGQVQNAFFEAACAPVSPSSTESLEYSSSWMGHDVAQRMFSASSGDAVKTVVLGEGASVYLAAVLEYLTAELLELSGNAARENRNDAISPRHIELALRNDEELRRALVCGTWSSALDTSMSASQLLVLLSAVCVGTGTDVAV